MDQVQVDNKSEEKKVPEQTVQTEQKEQVASTVAESDKEINWKKFKEARELERKQAAEIARKAEDKESEVQALKAAMDAILNKQPSQQASQSQGYEEEETEDQRIEKKVNALIAKKESEAERKRQEEEQTQLPNRLKTVHRDFDQVCSAANLDYLEYHHPELAKSLGRLPQSFDKWTDIYSAIKRYVPNTNSSKDQAKATANLQKPQSMSSPGLTQPGSTTSAIRLDEAKKAANWERMEKARKGIS